MDVLSFIVGIVAVFLVPTALGEILFSRFRYIGTKVALGWLLITGLMTLMSLFGILKVDYILILSLILMVLCAKKIRELIEIFFKEMKISFKELDFVFKCLLFLVLALFILRFFRAFIPLLNWDSLNNHLLLIRERLALGDLSLHYHIPTERRVPFLGVLAKTWAFSFDDAGRVLSMAHFSMYVYSALSIYQVLKEKVSRVGALISLSFYLALIELVVNSITAGDEALMALLVLGVILFLIQEKAKVKPFDYCLMFLLLGFLIAIKMTALFWVPLLGLFLCYFLKEKKVIMLIGVSLFMSLSSICYIHSYINYSVVYPFVRWSNLLYQGDKGERKVFEKSTMLEDRAKIGLPEHRDHGGLMASPMEKAYQNLIRLGKLPLGPFLLWFIVFTFISVKVKKFIEYQNIKLGIYLMVFCMISVVLSMIVWKFTPLAMFRYHSPTWGVFVLSCSLVLLIMSHFFNISHFLAKLMCLYLLFNFSLETKYVSSLYAKGSVFNTKQYWNNIAAEGKIIQELNKILKEDEKVFYIGINCFLLNGKGHFYAQIGNETGWRWVDDIPVFLKKNNLKYWVLCEGSRVLDEPYYYVVTNYLVKEGVLTKILDHTQGEIYKIN